MIWRLLLYLALAAFGLSPVAAQDAQSVLLARINNLRRSQGLPAYAISAALNAAARQHAAWMARTGQVSHQQEDGSGPRERARQAGYASNWVSENIYRSPGASPLDAWNWWMASPIHYAGIVSPNYDNVGIGSASGAYGLAYVLVFGNSRGRASAAGGQQLPASIAAAAPAAPAYVLGIDAVGNIQHEIQPGDTLGSIALIYGYSWADIPYMLEINDMTQADMRLIQPGAVFLVPPKDGTYTPMPNAAQRADETPIASEQALSEPAPAEPASAADSATAPAASATATSQSTATPRSTPVIRIGALHSSPGAPAPAASSTLAGGDWTTSLVLGAAIVAQLGILVGAALELARRST